MENIADTTRLVILHVFGWLLPATLLVWFYLVLDSHGLNPLKSIKRFIASIPPVGRIVLGVLLAGFIVYGSTKSGGGDTNSPPSRMSAPRRTPRLADIVAPEDIAHGWRVVTSAEAESIVDMPTGAVTNNLLRRRGGHDWAFHVEPEGWCFPYRDGVLTGVTVFAKGEVRPDVGTLYFPVPLTNGVSLLPEARWGLLGHAEPQRRREASVFRHAMTTNGSLLLDWHNALVGRDPNSPTNLQIELFSDGSFAWRTDGGSTSYLPVFPFDYDGDGLENSVDPEPLSPNSIDAHGTNAEWYRVVCSNVFEVTGTTGVPPVDDDSTDPGTTGILPVEGGSVLFKTNVNSRAYYFVDVVASSGPAPIYFNADRDSRLGSPVVVARAGETNHVPLLIGVEYAVTSAVPISVSAPDAMYATVTTNDERSATVKWPLEFSYSVSGGSYVVSVEPYDPGGLIEWEHTSPLDPFNISGGARLLSSPSPSGCGFTTGDRSLTFTCANCSCSGCTVSGVFCIEEASHGLGSFCCGCVYDPHGDDEPGGNPSPPADPDSPGVSVRFTQPAVIFEDAYANTYNQTVEKQSTTTTVSVEAYGGSDGGVVVVSITNADKLECLSGPSLPTSFMVSPYSRRAISVGYQGNRASGSADDIVVTAQMSGASSSASATAVKIEVVPEVQYPPSLPNRHTFGVCEEVGCYYLPGDLMGATWQSSGGTLESGSYGNKSVFQYCLTACETTFTFSYNSSTYSVQTRCVTPTSINCSEDPTIKTYTIPDNHTGGIGMHLDLALCPSNVSFKGFRVMEQAMNGTPTGYFTNAYFTNWWNHTKVQGANKVVTVGGRNDFGDDAEMMDSFPILSNEAGWSTGDITWPIQPVWRGPSDFFMQSSFKNLSAEQQKFTLDSAGTVGVEKFKHRVERPINGPPSQTTIP